MRVSSVLFGSGTIHVPKPIIESGLSEFAYLPKQNQNKPCISAGGFKKLLVGLAAIAVAITLSRLKMPLKKTPMDLINFLC